jgi:hypothetical protein
VKALPLIVAASALLTSCGLPESRLRAGLINAGLSRPLAACMVDRLSLMQLRRIGDLPRAREAGSVGEFLHQARSLRDPEILAVSAGAAATCEARRLVG